MTDSIITNQDKTKASGVELSTARRALLAMRDMRAELDTLRSKHNTPIAIVGMGCRYPGAASPDSFWKMLCEKQDGVTDVPADRWDSSRFFHPDGRTPGKTASRRGGFLDQLDRFDAAFFGISPREAPHVDPRQRKILEVAWEALEDAGIPLTSLAGTATGVYIATLSNDYDLVISRFYERITASTGPGTANSIIANRLSYFLDLHGPSLTLDTACSGSLVAIEMACRSLRAGESSLAIAGGVSINLLPKGDIFFSAAGALSPSGHCRTFDAGADGIVRSEGAGIVILKRAQDAIEDGDRIYAVIRGGAINHDGASNGIMAPNGEAQQRVLREAYKNAGVVPGEAYYIEAHGTGTPLGDPIEISALAGIMAEGRNGTPLLLGSLKTNVGHMEAAAGVASVMKAALAMYHGLIPPNREFREWNPRIPETPFALDVLREPRPWPPGSKRRIAGVSAFSFGGTNTHLVLEEAPAPAISMSADRGDRHFVLPISAKSSAALRASIAAYRDFLEQGAGAATLSDICFTAAVRRSHQNHRFAAVASSVSEIIPRLTPSEETGSPAKKLAFVFSGQGSHWKGMGAGLLETEPLFREVLEKCDRLFKDQTGFSVMAEMSSGDRLNQTDISQAAVFSIQVALEALWRSWGIEPNAVVGQSLGEIAAACTAGALSLESAVNVVHHRSRLMKTLAGQGRTAVVGLPPDETREVITEWSGQLYFAGNSSPQTSVVSGTPGAVRAILEALGKRGVFAQTIADVDVAFHSPYMDSLRGDLEKSLATITCAQAKTGILSTVTGGWLDGIALDASYWGRNLCEPFYLADALEELVAEGFDSFLEISPHPLLGGPIRQVVAHKGAEALVLGSCRRGEEESRTMMTSLAALYNAGREVRWSALYPVRGRCVSLPSYRWQRERYWVDQLPKGTPSSEFSNGHPFLGNVIESAFPAGFHLWEQEIDLNSPHYLSGHKVLGATVFPGAGYLETAFAATLQTQDRLHAPEVTELIFHEALTLSAESRRRIQVALVPDASGGYVYRFSARENDANEWTCHATGKARVSREEHGSSPIEEVRARCTELISAQQHYEAMAAQGLEYGDNFRAITNVWRTEGEAIAELELAPGLAGDAANYCVHPVLIDAALQVVAATIRPGETGVYSPESYVPRGIHRARFYSSPGARATCVARLQSGVAGDPELRADLLIVDNGGKVFFELEGLRLAHVGSGQMGARGRLRDWIYDVCWEEKSREESPTLAQGAWTIFGDADGFGTRLATILRARGIECITVPADEPDIEKYAGEAASGLVYLRGLSNAEEPCFVPLRLVKALAERRSKAMPALWIVTRETQPAGGRVPVLSKAAELWGFGKVVALEHPELRSSIVDLGALSPEEAELLADELLAPDSERYLAFHQGRRFVSKMRLAPDVARHRGVVFRADASYLITGGLGGLGLAVVRWMVERGARHFILAGRTPLPPRSQWLELPSAKTEAVRALERLGASVHTPALDVADAAEIKAFIKGFHAEGWPIIGGVIHAAGIVEDQFMLRLGEETFAKVLGPKVAGSLALHEATKDLPLDFFTLFSSLSSVLGQFGQAHYAAGNAFMDHLAHWRRSIGLPATTINWGPWAEVGLFARLESTDKSGRSGVFLMLPSQALEAMERIHALNPVQAVVVSADWSRIPPSPMVSELKAAAKTVQRSAQEEQASAALLLQLLLAEPDERRKRLEEHLTIAVARVLQLDPARLDPREPLTSLGMDSIMVVELKNHIEITMNLSMSMVDLFTGTIAKLAEQVGDKLADDNQIEELLTQVEKMSPEEIEALLGGESDLRS